MPLSDNKTFVFMRNLAAGVVGVLLVRFAYLGVTGAMRVDPFARFNANDPAGLGSFVGLRMTNVALRQFHQGHLTTAVVADRLDISKDRQSFKLYGLHDGVYRDNGHDYSFAAHEGEWNAIYKRLAVRNGVRVRDDIMDLHTAELTFDKSLNRLDFNDPVQGRYRDGQIKAQNLVLNTKDRTYESGPIEYHGTLASLQSAGVPADSAVRKWDIYGAHTKSTESGKVFYNNATATDGEILIKANLIEQDRHTDIVTATGKVFYFSAKADIVADKAVIFRKERRSVLTGHVTFFVKPNKDADKPPVVEDIPELKPTSPDKVTVGTPKTSVDEEGKKLDEALTSGKSMREYPLVAICQQVEYWYRKGSRRAKIVGSPQARQELPGGRWRHMWAFSADYDAEKDILKLFSTAGKSDIRMKNSKGDDVTARSLVLSTKEDAKEDVYDGDDVQGAVFSDSDEDPRPKPSTPNPANTKPTLPKSGDPKAPNPKTSDPKGKGTQGTGTGTGANLT